jgi:hypothetical protein
MNITNAQYVNKLETNEIDHIHVTIDSIKMDVPLDPANRHYAEIMRQVEAGTLTIADAD